MVYSVSAAGGPREPVISEAEIASLSPDGRTLAFLGSGISETRCSSCGCCHSQKLANRSLMWASPLRNRTLRRVPALLARRVQAGRVGADMAAWRARPNALRSSQPVKGPHTRRECSPGVRDEQSTPSSIGCQTIDTSLPPWSVPGIQGVHLWLVDTETGEMVPLTSGAGGENAPAVSADGQRIAYATQDAKF